MSDALQQMTAAQLDAARKVEKLLGLGRKNSNEHEAAAATAKAMALLAEHNLSMSQVEAAGGEDGKREEAKQKGGAYLYERALWRTVAELNFCLCFVHYEWVKYARPHVRLGRPTHTHGNQAHVALVGRKVNVAATKAMVGHLLQTVNRLCLERLHGDSSNRQFLSRWAVSWREGMVERVRERLLDRRQRQLDAEELKRRAATKAAMASGSTATALTLGDVKQSEKDLNEDFLAGDAPGTTARERAEAAAARATAEALYTAWAAANPEVARAAEEKLREERKAFWRTRRGGGGGGRAERDVDMSAYRDGFEKAEGVSLDQQAEDRRAKGALGHG